MKTVMNIGSLYASIAEEPEKEEKTEMKFIVTKASDWNYRSEIELSTLEELMEFIKNNGKVIIEANYELMIYDDWIE